MSEFGMPQQEIDRRIREIQNAWDRSERTRRKIVGQARRETLAVILQGLGKMEIKAA